MPETNDNQNAYRLRELAEGLDKLAGLVRELSPGSLEQVSAIGAVWADAPLILKLKFVRDVLPEKSELQPRLRQASALEELRQRGSELETWIERYPSLFADAMTLLTDDTVLNGLLTPEKEVNKHADILAMNTLVEARETLERELAGYGIEFVSVSPRDAIGLEHEVVGEEESQYMRAKVARVLRIGFRKGGNLVLPAQILRSSGPANNLYPIPVTQPEPAPSPNLSHNARTSLGRGTDSPNTEHPIPNTESEPAPSPNLSHQGRGTYLPNTHYPIPDTESEPAPSPNLSHQGRGTDSPNTDHPIPNTESEPAPSPNLSHNARTSLGRGTDSPNTEHPIPNTESEPAPSPNLSHQGRGTDSPNTDHPIPNTESEPAPSPNLSHQGRGTDSPNTDHPIPNTESEPAPSPNLSHQGRGTDSPNTDHPIPNTESEPAPSPNLSHNARTSLGRGTIWPNAECESTATNPESQTPSTSVLIPNTQHLTPPPDPEWLRILIQRTHGCEVEAVKEIVSGLEEIVEIAKSYGSVNAEAGVSREIVQLLESIAPLLSMRYADGLNGVSEDWGKPLLEARDSILKWLTETLSIDLISPNRGDMFNPLWMEEVETRRTVHANEIETVARIERIGLMRNGLAIVKAEVIRYVAGRE